MSTDEDAIKASMEAFNDAFNAHSAKRLGELFVEDADFVNIFGHWMQGRAAIEEGHAQGFASVLRSSQLSLVDIKVKLLKPDLALCHTTWSRHKTTSADDGSLPSQGGVLTSVLSQQNGKWLLVAAHNTQHVPLPVKP